MYLGAASETDKIQGMGEILMGMGTAVLPEYVLKLASGVWLGQESGHSSQRKTAPERARLVNSPAQQGSNQYLIQRSTYALVGQTIAVRVSGDPIGTNNGLYYMYSDHLGSASAIQKDGSTTVEQARYLPFGGWRTQPGNLPTNRGFTGHVMNNMGSGADNLGLIYMNARYYVSAIGRFASADTIVPNPTNPQSLNRYSYTRNSPLNLIDPTGHRECGASDNCGDTLSTNAFQEALLSAWLLYKGNFENPFEGTQAINED
jgi:RHS repeat-associated protein